MALKKKPEIGARVRLGKSTIEDIPKGAVGTVVAWGLYGDRTLVVSFDDYPSVRYLRKSNLDAALGPEPSHDRL